MSATAAHPLTLRDMVRAATFACILLIVVSGCSRSRSGVVDVACSPLNPGAEEWSILTISQFFLGNEPAADLDARQLGNSVSYSRTIDVRRQKPNHRLIVYRLRTVPGGQISITAKSFRNYPTNSLFRPITIIQGTAK